jgi:hypothetical protein
MKVGHPSIGYLNGFSFATPTAAPESSNPQAFLGLSRFML